MTSRYGWIAGYVPGTSVRREKLAAAKLKAEEDAVVQLRALMGSAEGCDAAQNLYMSEYVLSVRGCRLVQPLRPCCDGYRTPPTWSHFQPTLADNDAMAAMSSFSRHLRG